MDKVAQSLPSMVYTRLSFLKAFIRLHFIMSLFLLVFLFFPEKSFRGMFVYLLEVGAILYCLIFLVLIGVIFSIIEKSNLVLKRMEIILTGFGYIWVYTSQFLFYFVTKEIFEKSFQAQIYSQAILQVILVSEAFVIIPTPQLSVLHSCVISLIFVVIGTKDKGFLELLLVTLVLSLATFVILLISRHLPKKEISEIEVQTEESNIGGSLGNNERARLFENLPFPAFIIDLNVNVSAALPPIPNLKGRTLINSGQFQSDISFFDHLMLEGAAFSVSEHIRSVRRKVEQQCSYRDQVRLTTSTTRTYFDSIMFSFECPTKAISPPSQEESKEVVPKEEGDQRFLALLLLNNAKDPIEEKMIMKNFKGSLICSLSHELCTPINTILNLLLMMPSHESLDGKTDIKEVAVSNAEILNSKVQDLIDYTQIELKTFKAIENNFCVNDLFSELKQIFAYEARERNNEVIFKIKAKGRMWIIADRTRIRQILIKLISNANKYTLNGTITISVGEKPDTFNVVFQVKDTGHGIPRQQLDLIFSNVSERARLETNQRLGSTKLPGLGLAIARKICEALNSCLKARSSEGRGSLFFFEMPTCQMLGSDRLKDVDEIENDFKARSKVPFAKLATQRSFSSKKFVIKGANDNPPLESKVSESVQTQSAFSKQACEEKNPKREDKKFINNMPGGSPSNKIIIDSRVSEVYPLGHAKVGGQKSRMSLLAAKQSSKDLIFTGVKSGELKCPEAEEKKEKEIAPGKCREKVVLVADDYAGNRLVLVQMLENLKVKSIEAINGQEAYKIVAKSLEESSSIQIELILMDLDMPVMDGIQATRKIRSLEGKLSTESAIPIAAVTAFNSENERQNCFEAGMQHFVPKPVKMTNLRNLVKKYCTETKA